MMRRLAVTALATTRNDVFELTFSATTLGSGTAVANAELFFDGDGKVKFDTANENLDALTLIVEGVAGNAPPVLSNSGPAESYTEGAAPTIIDSTITLVDGDSPDFATGLISVEITTGGSTGDRLLVNDEGAGPGQIGVSGSDITYGGVVIGSFSGGANETDPLVISLNANADALATQALLRNIAYWNTSDSPLETARSIEFSMSDGDGGASNVISQTVNVTAVAGNPIAVDDTFGLDFDGEDDYVLIADSPSLTMTNTMTMEAWINPDASTNVNRMIINKEGEYEVALFSDNQIYWAFANSDPGWAWHGTGYTVNNGEWNHIAVAYDNGAVSTYVNGKLVDFYAGSGTIGDAHATLDDLRIGGRSNNPAGKFFDGKIDDVRIWSTARTQAEIEAGLDGGVTGAEAGLAGYWKFNEASGTVADDATANDNDGVLTELSGLGTPLPTWVGYQTDQNTVVNVPVGTGVLANDFDSDGDPITVIELDGVGANIGVPTALASGALVTLNADGSFDYDPNGAFDHLPSGVSATDSFEYTIDDGSGTATATATITVLGTNDAPQATKLNTAESYTEDIALNLTDIVVTDADDTDVTVTLTLSDVGAGTLSTGTSGAVTATFGGGVWTASGAIADVNALLASVTFTPTADYAGDFSIATSVDDGEAAPVTGIKNFTAIAVNDAPELLAGTINNLTVNEDSGFTSLGLASLAYGPGGGADETSQTLSFQVTVIPSPTFGDIFLSDGLTKVTTGTYSLAQLQGMQFKPASNASGGPSFFSWQVIDDGGTANGGSNTTGQSIQLNITPFNDEQSLDINTGLTLSEGGTAAITSSRAGDE